GGSNGGLLMGVEFTQHPEMWTAVDIQVPLLDMLRYGQIAAGSSWVGEYGSVSVPAERKFLEYLSPYNNVRANVKYPEPLIWTTTKDDRVGPQHAEIRGKARVDEHSVHVLRSDRRRPWLRRESQGARAHDGAGNDLLHPQADAVMYTAVRVSLDDHHSTGDRSWRRKRDAHVTTWFAGLTGFTLNTSITRMRTASRPHSLRMARFASAIPIR